MKILNFPVRLDPTMPVDEVRINAVHVVLNRNGEWCATARSEAHARELCRMFDGRGESWCHEVMPDSPHTIALWTSERARQADTEAHAAWTARQHAPTRTTDQEGAPHV